MHFSKLQSESDHRFIEFDIKAPEIQKKKRTVMTKENEKAFTREMESVAEELLSQVNREHTTVDSIEHLPHQFTTSG